MEPLGVLRKGVFAVCWVLWSQSLLYSQTQPWSERIDFYGDLRLRYDATQHDGYQDVFRYRLRVGLEAALSDAITAGVEIRSGNPRDPVSDNQSFGGGLSKHDFSVAEVFGDFRLSPRFSVVAGKFEHSQYWVVSDMQWDEDVTVEGLMERIELRRGDDLLRRLDASIYQLFLAEADQGDAWLFGAQVRPSLQIGDDNALTIGAAFDYLLDPQRVVDLTLEGELAGNTMTNLLDESGRLISDFRILTGSLIWRNQSMEDWTLSSSFFLYKNTGASNSVGTETSTGARDKGSENDTAFFFRFAADQGPEPGKLLIRFAYYYSEPDAILYAFMQSDTRRSSNLNGTRVDLRVGMPARTYFNITWYRTKPKLGADTTMNRWLIDYVLPF